jgi:hypothetical protein
MEIDRRRLDALALLGRRDILGRRDDALGKRRLRHPPAMRTTIDRGLVSGDCERAFGKVENLPLLNRRRLRIKRRTAMAASAGLVPNPGVRIGHCRNVPPLRPFWPPLGLPERPRGRPAIRGFFLSPSLEGGLELFELSRLNRRRRSATSARSAVISALSQAIKSATSAGISIPPLIQIRSPRVSKTSQPKPNSPTPWPFGLTSPSTPVQPSAVAISLFISSNWTGSTAPSSANLSSRWRLSWTMARSTPASSPWQPSQPARTGSPSSGCQSMRRN